MTRALDGLLLLACAAVGVGMAVFAYNATLWIAP